MKQWSHELPFSRVFWAALFLALPLLMLACDGCGTGGPDPGDASTQDGITDKVPVRSLSEPLSPGETRVGQIKEKSALFRGADATGRVGDWKLYNRKVSFVISGVGPSLTPAGRGGHLVDAVVNDKDGKPGIDFLEEFTSIVALLRVFRPESVKVLEPGGPNKPAILRFTGKDIGFPAFDMVFAAKSIGVTIEVDYILRPDSSALEITTRLKGITDDTRAVLGDATFLGDQTTQYFSGYGVDKKSAQGKLVRWAAAIGQGVGYLLTSGSDKTPMRLTIAQVPFLPFIRDADTSEGHLKPYTRFLYVNNGDLQGLLNELQQRYPTPDLVSFQGTVSNLRAPVLAQVQLLNDKGVALFQTRPDPQGRFAFKVPKGKYKVRVLSPGQKTLTTDISEGKNATLSMEKGGTLQISVQGMDADGKNVGFVPVRLQLTGAQSQLLYITTDQQKIPVAAGQWKVLFSRGLSWEFVQKNIEVKEGETLPLTVEIKQAYATKGYVVADMHLHTTKSIDSEITIKRRIKSLVAEGLQFVASTDHDIAVDYTPTIEELQMKSWLQAIAGKEISPIKYHFGAFPFVPTTTMDAYYNTGWAMYNKGRFQRVMTGPEIWAAVKKRNPKALVQLNHPRSNQAFLEYIKYSVKNGVSSLKSKDFNENWDTMEILNGGGRDAFLTKTLPDWFSLLNQGFLKTAVGNSDSHGDSEVVGATATLIQSSLSTPGSFNVDELLSNLKQNKAQVYAGPFLDVTVDGKPAAGARLKTGTATLKIRVLAPGWVPVSYLVIYVNGKETRRVSIPDSTKVVRFELEENIKVSKDSWVVVMAGDDKRDMKPVYPGRRPISMTNPLYLDVDGDGFNAPGLP